MNNVEENIITGEKVYKYVLGNGLKVYICPKPNFSKKVGMFGTHYGSIDTEFLDIRTNEKVRVPDGIAHFLEHKLFEQEDGNALDMFAQMGVSSNAYTSYDHTVYFFETNDKFDISLKTLLKFITSPYFTDENVKKEKGIIEQELNMYEDSADSVVYYNVLRGMYNNYPLNVDIGGTVKSVYSITKEELYTCYNAFYNPANMFLIVIGDVNIEQTLETIKKEQENIRCEKQPTRFYPEEPSNIAIPELSKELDIYMPNICIGFKLDKKQGKQNVRDALITSYINEICFGELSDFHEELYNNGLITSPVYLTYESGVDFSHMIFFFSAIEYIKCEEKIKSYLQRIKENGIDESLFEIVKNKKIGQMIYETEDIMHVSREIIDSIIEQTDVYEEAKIIKEITVDEINQYIKGSFDFEKMVISRTVPRK